MVLKCLSKSLNEKLGKLETVVKNAGSNSLYKDLKIDVVNNLAYITSVNAKVCVIERLKVEADSNFSFLVEASSFIKFMKKQKNREITILLSDRKIRSRSTTLLVSIVVRLLISIHSRRYIRYLMEELRLR